MTIAHFFNKSDELMDMIYQLNDVELDVFPVAFYQDWVQGDTPPPQPCGLFCMYCCKTEGPEGIFWGQAKTHFG